MRNCIDLKKFSMKTEIIIFLWPKIFLEALGKSHSRLREKKRNFPVELKRLEVVLFALVMMFILFSHKNFFSAYLKTILLGKLSRNFKESESY